MNIRLHFDRNHTIGIVIVPLIAIFFLLGGIFVFDARNNIAERLTLTLSIFAIIFTLPEIIDSMKPSAPGPTIADTLLSLIIISTMAFTVSSVISTRFTKHYGWIDVVVFIIVAGAVIMYFRDLILDISLWWLIPIILIGLGYGLLLRMFGVGINRPIIRLFRGYGTKKVDMAGGRHG